MDPEFKFLSNLNLEMLAYVEVGKLAIENPDKNP